MEEGFTLVEGFSNEFVLLVIRFEDGFLKISDSTVYQFGRLG